MPTYERLPRFIKDFGALSREQQLLFIAAVESGAEPALVAEEHACGIRVEPGDPAALSETIVGFREDPHEEMGSNGRRALVEYFDRPIATEAYRRLLESVV